MSSLANKNVVKSNEQSQKDWSKVVIISDCSLDKKIKKELGKFWDVIEYDEKIFTNRSFEDLEKLGMKMIYIPNNSKSAREWLMKNIPLNINWNVVIAHNNKAQKWIYQLEHYASVICKYSRLLKIKGVSVDEIVNEFKSLNLDLHKSASICCGFLCPGRLKKKNQDEE